MTKLFAKFATKILLVALSNKDVRTAITEAVVDHKTFEDATEHQIESFLESANFTIEADQVMGLDREFEGMFENCRINAEQITELDRAVQEINEDLRVVTSDTLAEELEDVLVDDNNRKHWQLPKWVEPTPEPSVEPAAPQSSKDLLPSVDHTH